MVSTGAASKAHCANMGKEKRTSVLTADLAVELCPQPFRLVAKAKGFSKMEDLSNLQDLDYIDLGDNKFSNLHGISGIQRLKTIILKGNRLRSIDDLGALSNIRVLNLAENKLASLESIADSSFASELITLVIGGNRLQDIEAVTAFPKLRTLVISNNRIEDISPAAYLPQLTKLSASHNTVEKLPPALAHLDKLEELRLAHNKLTELPEKDVLENWSALRILDVGHNAIACISSLSALAKRLVAVNFAGNPVATQDTSTYRKMLLGACPGIEIIDGVRLQGGRKKVRVARKMREDAARWQDKTMVQNTEAMDVSNISQDLNRLQAQTASTSEENSGKTRKAARKTHREGAAIDSKQAEDRSSAPYVGEQSMLKKRKLRSGKRQAEENDESDIVTLKYSKKTYQANCVINPSPAKLEKKKKRKRERDDEEANNLDMTKTAGIVKQNESAASPDDDDNTVDASEFLKRASGFKVKVRASIPSHLNKELKGEDKNLKKSRNRSSRMEKLRAIFGEGGESQWD